MKKKLRIATRIKRIVIGLALFFFISSVSAVILYRFVPVPASPLMFIRLFQQKAKGEELKWKHKWVPKEDISPHLANAVIASEDNLFPTHHGFDFKAIETAIIDHSEKGKRLRGGSTISQQTAKNVFLWPSSTWVRKGFEAYFTVLIELFWSKERIMEVYLNTIEMGDGIYGAEAVAQAHFGTSAANLTRQQCALIAATLPNPLKYDSAHPTPYLLKRRRQILRVMRHLPYFPPPKESK
ncbi:MAG: monofunctional biosynthetic peptidoglycan transglycosylase [Bacteroidaceae bacterium]|jgi:monofunctional biosynthetic peptidoglycan transglycosylase